MDEFDLETEFADLLRNERRKAPFYVEPLYSEQQNLMQDFQEHQIALYSLDGEITVDSLFEVVATNSEDETEAEDVDEDRQAQLLALALIDIEHKYPGLSDGELEFTGQGLFMYQEDTNEAVQVELLESGDHIRGDVQQFAVAELTNPDDIKTMLETAVNGEEATLPGGIDSLWVVMKGVVVTDAGGYQRLTLDEAIVPLGLKDLRVGKVIRRDDDAAFNRTEHIDSRTVKDTLTGLQFIELCNRIENDLNNNDYYTEEASVIHQAHIDDLADAVSSVSTEKTLVLSAAEVEVLGADDAVALFEQTVVYDGPTIVRISGLWKVIHGFSIVDVNQKTTNVLYVLPENIHDVQLDTLI